MALSDGEQRAQATDPYSSFIVQAPAGSGKTEILTQRYLRLLSTVKEPEQIIALTFTRKAASEMRERIIIALQDASSSKKAETAHQQMTLNFAEQALKQSERYQWSILQQPNRLRVSTIDSLCQSINHAIPLLEQQISYAQISEKPQSHYLDAARQCIEFAIETPEYQEAIRLLLLHVDNKQEHLLTLFIQLLAQRDQWISALLHARTQEKADFEKALVFIEKHELARFKSSLPWELAQEVVRLCKELALIENNPESPRYPLINWNEFNQANQEIANSLCCALLGSDQNFRKSFDHHVGLKSDACPAVQYRRLKEESIELLIKLSEYPDFLPALLQVAKLPKPEYDPEQWEVLQALFTLLPILVSHLHLIFSEQNQVDFTAISQQALKALGAEDNPTELALYLDNAIHHLLVDEFQDTSITQFELLTQLVQGWQEGDGKTLFIVGDPMQSIYRFRQAEVGLFFRAKTKGIGSVVLKSLELQCNFRSTPTIVNWVNTQFSRVFPSNFDIESGAVSFHPSVHVLKDESLSAIHAIECSDREQEAEFLIQQIKHELNSNPEQSIALLVRSRSQLPAIIHLLREQEIPYQGTDIDLLAHLIHLRDVWSLTQALLMPGNRLAWLSALRSPYCGLALNEVHLIAQHNKKRSIYSALLQLNKIEGLSDEARTRAQFFTEVMHEALSQRCQVHLSDWISKTLKKLHIDLILNPNQMSDLEQYWTLLDRYEQQGRLANIDEFLLELNSLYSQQSNSARLQIMTIHKSKGLEFDTVFLPSLGSQANRRDNPLLRWLKLPTQTQENLLLISPIKAAHQEHCALYDYLSDLDEEKSSYESQRLLYVAVTRAKSRLYLSDSSSKSSKKSFRSLLKDQPFSAHQDEDTKAESTQKVPKLTKIPLAFHQENNNTINTPMNKVSANLSLGTPRLIGIVTHKLLQWICDYHPQSLTEIPWEFADTEFKKLGFSQELREAAIASIKIQISQFFSDPIGIWIRAKHENEHNEYELLIERQNHLLTRIIDRTFEAPKPMEWPTSSNNHSKSPHPPYRAPSPHVWGEGNNEGGYLEETNQLWIIDFKTGKEDLDAKKKHQQQLNEYGTYLSKISSLPIRCGLYYLTNNHWIHWQYATEQIPG